MEGELFRSQALWYVDIIQGIWQEFMYFLSLSLPYFFFFFLLFLMG